MSLRVVIVANTFFPRECIKLKSFMSIHININTNTNANTNLYVVASK